MEKTVFFVRHGETDFNKRMIVQGSGVDSDLNAEGLAQGKAFYDAYFDFGFETVMTSKLKRTHQTVGHFIDAGIQWEQYMELNEISWGIHEGKAGDIKMRDNYLELNAAWTSGDYDARIPEGESARELGERVGRFIEMLKQREEEKILVCTHGRTLCAVSCFLDYRPLKDMKMFKHRNTGITKAYYNGGMFKIIIKNDTSHL